MELMFFSVLATLKTRTGYAFASTLFAVADASELALQIGEWVKRLWHEEPSSTELISLSHAQVQYKL